MTLTSTLFLASGRSQRPKTVLTESSDVELYEPEEMVSDLVVAKLLGVKRATVQRWRLRRVGPPFHKCGRAIRYKVDEVRAYLAQHRVRTRDA